MRDGVEALWNKINELRNEVSEHEQVLRALEPMDANRRCYRLVGDVLVEKTVGEVIPIIKQNEQGLKEVISGPFTTDGDLTISQVLEKLAVQLERDGEALAAFQKKYKVRVKVDNALRFP